MKKYLFVSDFDGTLTERDFYWIVIDKYLKERGLDLYRRWKAGEFTDVVFLGEVFRSINRTEDQILDDIKAIPLDPNAVSLITKVQASGGDFAIISAGTRYYIDRLFELHGIKAPTIYSNDGYYENKGIQLKPDPNHWAYSERYGIDKAKIVEHLKKDYSKVFYVGDSGPDVAPALLADQVFAKAELQGLLAQRSHPFIAVDNMADVERYLAEEGYITC